MGPSIDVIPPPHPPGLNRLSAPRMQQVTPGAAHLSFTLGALVAVGGIAGYASKRSLPSVSAPVRVTW